MHDRKKIEKGVKKRSQQKKESSLVIKVLLLDCFKPAYRAADGGIVHAEIVSYFLHGVNAGEESAGHCFTASGVGALVVAERASGVVPGGLRAVAPVTAPGASYAR